MILSSSSSFNCSSNFPINRLKSSSSSTTQMMKPLKLKLVKTPTADHYHGNHQNPHNHQTTTSSLKSAPTHNKKPLDFTNDIINSNSPVVEDDSNRRRRLPPPPLSSPPHVLSPLSAQPIIKKTSRKSESELDLTLSLKCPGSDHHHHKKHKKNLDQKTSAPEEELDIVAKTLKGFSIYTHQEEIEELFWGVCTKLKLFDDLWKIRKVLAESDCNQLCRLMVPKDLVQKHIINVWNDVGRTKLVNDVPSKEGVLVNIWDYDREMVYNLSFKKLPSSECYIFAYNWSSQFVKERRLKKGDEIGIYWDNPSSQFVFSVLSRAPDH